MSELNEPSVLDYLKYRLGMIKVLDIPVEKRAAPVEDSAFASEIEDAPKKEASVEISAAARYSFPWRSSLALLLALMGQFTFEPPHTAPWTGLALYLAAFFVLGLAYRHEAWDLAPLRENEAHTDEWDFKRKAFFLAIPLALVAFFAFAGNLFSFFNVFPWLLSLALFIWALWQSDVSPKKTIQGLKTFIQQRDWQITISRWTLLVLAASAVVLFFRLYQINTVPAEPFSDHAEKILDVYDITQGDYHVFFPRNTGREAIQMYWTLLVAKIFGTGLSFLSLKLGTAVLGLLTLPYIYLFGKEVANERVGLLAFFMFGIAYWTNASSRVGLRFPLYPLFVAPTLFYLLRGIRRQSRNDFILAGLSLGLGAHGYSPFRIMPFVVVAAVGLYWLHEKSASARKQAFTHLLIVAFISVIVFLPLGRYALSNPDGFSYRAFSRLDNESGDTLRIFASNFVDGLKMLNWDNGVTWVHSVPGRPGLDVVSGALFLIGILFLILRYARSHHWLDLFLLLSIPLLELPSTLSIAFPEENPALNRAGGAAVVVFVVVALAFDGLLSSLRSRASRDSLSTYGWVVTAILLLFSMGQNYNLVFDQYATQFKQGAWNSSNMGQFIREYERLYGQTDSVWIVPYPYWVDTRLPGVWAGIPNRDFALWQNRLADSLNSPSPKLFMFKPEDEATQAELKRLYPNGILSRYQADFVGHDFMLFSVP